jgi:hypothetical protein
LKILLESKHVLIIQFKTKKFKIITICWKKQVPLPYSSTNQHKTMDSEKAQQLQYHCKTKYTLINNNNNHNNNDDDDDGEKNELTVIAIYAKRVEEEYERKR